jgi:tRNA threonylcarbamoyladenosine modification (KEOPS) complex Cgi121 subunit
LTKEAEILGKHLIITGFREAEIENLKTFFDRIQERIRSSHVQFFDARLIAGLEHLYFAALNALTAFETRLNISRNPAIEALLYASGQHQIEKAIETVGIAADMSEIAVLIMSETEKDARESLRSVSDLLRGEICDDILKLTEEKMEIIGKLFSISDLELEAASRGESSESALVDLVIEHVALLAAKR